MNIQKFIFKFFVVLSYILRFSLLVLPLAMVVVISKEGGWKYGFTFIQNNIEVALFVSFAIGFLVAMYHAVSYEIVGEGPLENYLKSEQKVQVKGAMSLDELKGQLENNPVYTKIATQDGRLTARRKVHFLSADKVEVFKDGDTFNIESKPFSPIWFIDFGRNFGNVKWIAETIKLIK